MYQVKIFTESDTRTLETRINQFLKQFDQNGYELLDIKLSATDYLKPGGGNPYKCTAMIIYRG
ncbi:sporulation protein Cse60 [Staphylospora marina]|uniref:sporulation protein Cse60 n=1 Tax=Staphylospora marina TaxID=2490858 RepID=UPI0013DDC7EA|nr:sporulation protein Cse60 [Staphylospora marina]